MSRSNFDLESIKGKALDEAQKIAGHSGYTIAVRQEDGEMIPVPLEVSQARILVSVEKQIVKTANFG